MWMAKEGRKKMINNDINIHEHPYEEYLNEEGLTAFICTECPWQRIWNFDE